MTFYEAAVEVLRVAGRPLHYKKITEIAIKRGLLSHIGKTPELTMGSRLNQEVRKDDGHSIVLRTRPGVFTLRSFSKTKEIALRETITAEAPAPAPETKAAPVVEVPEEAEAVVVEIVEVAEAAPEEPASQAEDKGRKDNGRRRRRRRKRSENDREARSEPSPMAGVDLDTVVNVESALAALVEEPDDEPEAAEAVVEEAPSETQEEKLAKKVVHAETPAKEASAAHEKPSAPKVEEKKEVPAPAPDAVSAEPPELDGISQAAYKVLSEEKKALSSAEIGDLVFGRRMVRFHTLNREAAIRAALVTDNQIRLGQGKRPIFHLNTDNAWVLTEWGFDAASLKAEAEIQDRVAALKAQAEKEIASILPRVSREGLEHLTLTLLRRMDYGDIKVSKRLGDGGVIFTGRLQRGLSDVRVAIYLTGGERVLSDQDVTSLRGTLHHYAASEGVIITLGAIAQEARQESRAANLARINILDQENFVRLLTSASIGVQTYQVPVSFADRSFFLDLGLVE